ncbi:MAG: SUMF1/EgtB/PvdO family nonheme iron enzyme [Bacteroidetes bacterium]|nr:SUMF1/EgtB/PvdO family nonheme iron enzyme [Bacteroidota bacterium]MBT4338138.1 SUMF1/EgtB/PvdO family nonheme iron enzyme [Bacteroidota bacterium]MBT4727962.1 SUMF1/EgtB/PvdO family nonheme iron enzyme [Bacteroidota bacterium]MBT5990925.1 SUMF1/EgtB/PvdO family nonheme iron enzyme [Bacteroidota bacterium]MBT6837613.1 SUMF1/EgtB/PvdO family nonheme iron enzyme [Bacteroidota bacterium]
MKAIIKFSILFCFLAAQLTIISAQNKTQKLKVKKPKATVKEIDESLAKVYDSLYASKYELSNKLYRMFEYDLLKSNQSEFFKIALIDSNVWTSPNEPMVIYYHRHPNYNDYPVVGVSHEAAKLFCNWLTDKYNISPKRKFKKVIFRLPTESEWELAARGGRLNTVYPWGGPYLRNSKGRFLCNFQNIGDENIIYDSLTNKFVVEFYNSPNKADTIISGTLLRTTVPVTSFYNNNIGLYNIAGNVAEMVNEKGISRGGGWRSPGGDVQNESRAFYSKPDNDLGFRIFMVVIEE